MKSIQKITGILMAAIAIMALSGTAGFAAIAPLDAFGNADLIALTQNHARTIAFSLDSPAGGAGGVHAIYFLNIGNNNEDPQDNQDTRGCTYAINFLNNTPLPQGTEVVYFVAGMIFSPAAYLNAAIPFYPVLQYIYSTGGTLSLSVNVTRISFGVFFVGILYADSGVDYPMTMVATAALQSPQWRY